MPSLSPQLAFVWTVNRVYVPEGYNLRLRYKGPFFMTAKEAEPGSWAKEDEVGVRQKLRGPGRHFYCPVWWERELVPDVVIEPGEVGIVTCKLGRNLPEGEFLVDGDIGAHRIQRRLEKGIGARSLPDQRLWLHGAKSRHRVQTVGRSTSNILAGSRFPRVTLASSPTFPTIRKTESKKGIQRNVFPPGIYPDQWC